MAPMHAATVAAFFGRSAPWPSAFLRTSILAVLLAIPAAAVEFSFDESRMEYGPGHNGGYFGKEKLITPKGKDGKKPHVVFVLLDDYGWANAGWHSIGNQDVYTPHMNQLVKEGIELDHHYVYKYCSPTRSAIQSGRNPIHVNFFNLEPTVHNPEDTVSGFAGIPRNMTGVATKMAAGGYKTHMFGKWDAGMATYDHTPRGRGYMTSLNYFHHANNYWDQTILQCKDTESGKKVPVVDLWLGAVNSTEKGALGYNSTCVKGGQGKITGAGCEGGIHGDHWYHGYEDALFEQQVLKTIDQHNPKDPFFLFWAPHAVHTPLQVPEEFYTKFGFIQPTDNLLHSRQTYSAMVAFSDAAIGNMTAKLKEKNMWEDTIMVFSADNGGPVYNWGTAGANNYPLRGGKMSNFQGGVRVNAFVSGGYLPKKVRGTKFEGLVTGWDWYATFAELGGVDPTDQRAKAAGLPPIDSHSMVDVLMGRATDTNREEIPLGTEKVYSYGGDVPEKYLNYSVSGVVRKDGLKILVGDIHMAGWQGPHYPNKTSSKSNCFMGGTEQGTCILHCNPMCLFNITKDPAEHENLHGKLDSSEVKDMLHRLDRAQKSVFLPNRGGDDGKACKAALSEYGGFWGPFIE